MGTIVQLTEWAVSHPAQFAALYGAVEAGAAWVGYKYSKYQIDNIKKVYNMVIGSKRRLPYKARNGKLQKYGMPGNVYPYPKPAPEQADLSTAKGVLHGANITVGLHTTFTKDYLRAGKKKNMSLGSKYTTRSGIFFWQSINELNLSGGSTRSLELKSDYSTLDKILLPVYAVNLTALAWQGREAATSNPQYQAVPVYRLSKNGNLSTASQQYKWESITGYDANSSIAAKVSNRQWHNERLCGLPEATPYYRHLWSNIRLLLQCGSGHECTVHTDIVRFHNECGPQRELKLHADGTTVTFDAAPDSRTASSNDVFWESFMAKRVVHPLSRYTNTDKDLQLEFLAKGSVKLNNQSAERSLHNRNIFFVDGRVRNVCEDRAEDASYVPALNTDENTKNGPLVGVHVAGTNSNCATGTNQVLSYKGCTMYQRRAEMDNWLLIYGDMFYAGDISSSISCSFDMTVRNKYEWMASGQNTVETILPG